MAAGQHSGTVLGSRCLCFGFLVVVGPAFLLGLLFSFVLVWFCCFLGLGAAKKRGLGLLHAPKGCEETMSEFPLRPLEKEQIPARSGSETNIHPNVLNSVSDFNQTVWSFSGQSTQSEC